MTSLSTADEIVLREADGLYEKLRANRERGAAVTQRSAELLARSNALHHKAWEACMRAKAARDWAAATRVDRCGTALYSAERSPVKWFTVTGTLGDRAVSARWEAGMLSCDPRLLTQAQLFVDMGCVFRNGDPPAWVEATLNGPAAAVMLTLAQACDQVTAIDFEPVDGR